MLKPAAEKLWTTILAYADASAAMAEEGNSGEFHNDKEAAALEEHKDTTEGALVMEFGRATGWYPYLTVEKDGTSFWTLSKKVPYILDPSSRKEQP